MPTAPSWKLYNAELVAWAAEERARMERGESRPYHAVLCDPPYLIGFMSKEWDGICSPILAQEKFKQWGEALKPLLHPGALVFMFAGTRMWHRLAAGMEDAGFQMWDTLLWLHGQGFPKAQAIDALVDKGQRRLHVQAAIDLGLFAPQRNLDDWTKENHSPGDGWWNKFKEVLSAEDWRRIERRVVETGQCGSNAIFGCVNGTGRFSITSPTEISAPWAGHKTAALKPAWEPVLCFRAPDGGRTYAELALAHGSGALNVDAGRIGLDAAGWGGQGGSSMFFGRFL